MHSQKEILKRANQKKLTTRLFEVDILCFRNCSTCPQFTTKAIQASAVMHNTIRKTLHPHQFQPEAEEIPHFNHRNTVAWSWFSDYYYYYFFTLFGFNLHLGFTAVRWEFSFCPFGEEHWQQNISSF